MKKKNKKIKGFSEKITDINSIPLKERVIGFSYSLTPFVCYRYDEETWYDEWNTSIEPPYYVFKILYENES